MTDNAPRLAARFVDTVLGKIRVQVSPGTGPAVLLWPGLLMTHHRPGSGGRRRRGCHLPVAETRAIAESIPNAAFNVFDGIAHRAALEDPARMNGVLYAFLFSAS